MDCIETIVKKLGDGYLYLEDRRTELFQVTEFSNTKKHRPGAGNNRYIILENDQSLKSNNYLYVIELFPKGRYDPPEDLVFLNFMLIPRELSLYWPTHESILCVVEWTCLVSVVDSEGCLRYPQSLAMIYDEKKTFWDMMKILRYKRDENKCVSFFASMKGILDVCALAHFYGMERVLDTCRCWLRLICRNHSSCVTEEVVSAISELSEFYEDSIFREIVEAFARNESETETQSGVEQETWTCERLPKRSGTWDELFSFVQPAKNKKKGHLTEDVSALSHCYI